MKFTTAMTKRLREYEKVIEGKKDYIDNCEICFCSDVIYKRYASSANEICTCPLYPCMSDERPDIDKFYALSCEGLNKEEVKKKMQKMAKKRYNWLIKKLEKSGYEYK